jgi:hypothetical protein
MSLRYGCPLVAIPGPSVIPDRVLNAMHRAMPNIYEGDLVEMSKGILGEVGSIARTRGESFIAVTNGHGAWDMALSNTLSRGDKVLVLESGRFAVGWGEMAAVSGVEVEVLHASPRRAVDPAAVEERLRADTGHRIKAVLVVQIDTASSVWNDIAAIRRAIDAAGHPALYMVDCIASLGCVPYEMDEWLAKGADGPAGPGLQLGQRKGDGSAQDRRAAQRILGLDQTPVGRLALLALLRHAADLASLRAARGAGHDIRGRAGERLGPAPCVRRSHPRRGRGLGQPERARPGA